MNKETRTFIFGMFMGIISCIAIAIHIVEMMEHRWIINWVNPTFLLFSILGAVIGFRKIYSTID